MPKLTKPLTDTEVKNAKVKDKDYTLQDGNGLMLLVKPSGTKLWRLRYTHHITKKRVLIGVGRYPELSLSKARDFRKEALELLALGKDPLTERKELEKAKKESRSNTLESVANAWMEVKKSEVSADHATDIMRSLELHVFPKVGSEAVTDITASMLIESLAPLKVAGKLEMIRRICQRLNEILDYAANTGLITANPATGIKKAFQKPKPENMPAIGPDEVPQFMRDLNRASITTATRCLIEFQLHTMTRPNEATGARWDEIDFKNKIWIIPAVRMKSSREHSIPLTEQSIEILMTMHGITNHREHVFASMKNPRTHMNVSTANMAIKRMGYKGKLVAHGLRSVASTTLNEKGFDPDVIEAALAHVDKNSVRRAYNRAEYLSRRRKMMEWWSNFIEKCARGSSTIGTSKNGLSIMKVAS